VHRLAEESGEHRALVLTLAYTGIRWGEAVALRVADVHFLRRRLSVSQNAVQIGTRHAVGPTKGRKARSVPVPGFVLDELSVQCRGKASVDLVFAGSNGGYLPRPKSSNGWFTRAVERAGVQKITPHDLRHACASLAVSAGVNVLALQRMLGHKSAKITLDTYADLFDDDLDDVASTLHARHSPKCAQNALTEHPQRSAADVKTPFTCADGRGEMVRAEGLEPSSSLEHRHLKPACLPNFITPAACRSYRSARRRICRRSLLPWVHHGGERGAQLRSAEEFEAVQRPHRNRYERLCDRASDGHTAKDGVGLAQLQITNSSKTSECIVSLRH
jgi:integrase-like protein